MRLRRAVALAEAQVALVVLVLALASPAAALIVGGGGSAAGDCLTVFDAGANVPARRPRSIRCADGDACDADGVVNGRCEFPIAVCANSTFDARCTLAGVRSITVDHARDDGDPKFDPEAQALQTRIETDIEPPSTGADRCTTATAFHVAIKGPFGADGCKGARKVVRVVTLSTPLDGRVYKDTDKIKLVCDPAPAGCAPQTLFGGTFDRIQKQIFTQSCAVSGCHDSQSRTGNLLLETGAAYANLVGITPTNPVASAAGWKRVAVLDAATGDPETSLLLAKVAGPPPGFGSRMPFGRPPLAPALVDLIRLWIAAGAPQAGWVPGTD